jgi:hypothetical protein
MPVPAGSLTAYLNGVSCSSSTACMAVGQNNDRSRTGNSCRELGRNSLVDPADSQPTWLFPEPDRCELHFGDELRGGGLLQSRRLL